MQSKRCAQMAHMASLAVLALSRPAAGDENTMPLMLCGMAHVALHHVQWATLAAGPVQAHACGWALARHHWSLQC